MDTTESFIRKELGQDVEPCRIVLTGRALDGFRLRVKILERTSDWADALKLVRQHSDAFHQRGVQLFVGGPCEYRDHRDEMPVYAVPGMTDAEVIEFAHTGTHNDGALPFDANALHDRMRDLRSRDPSPTMQEDEVLEEVGEMLRRIQDQKQHLGPAWTYVQAALKNVAATAPFIIVFADEAGLEADFIGEVRPQSAQEILNEIVTINPEAMDVMLSELQQMDLPLPMSEDDPDMPDYDAAMVKYITQVGRLKLWWD